MYKLSEITFFKQDISFLNTLAFKEKGVLIIYTDHLKIENALFIQEISFNIIKSFETFDEKHVITLIYGEKIILEFDDINQFNNELKTLILDKINQYH